MRRNLLALGLFALGGCNQDTPLDSATRTDFAAVDSAGNDGAIADATGVVDVATSPDVAFPGDDAAGDAAPTDDIGSSDLALPADLSANPPDLATAVDALLAAADRAVADTALPPDASNATPDQALPDLHPNNDLTVTPHRPFALAGAPIYNQGEYGYSRYLAVGDFNGDGRDDVITSSSGATVLMLARTDGSLGRATLFPDGGRSCCFLGSGLATADLDGDGKLNVVGGDFNYATMKGAIDVVRGDGMGAFGYTSKLDTGNFKPTVARIADVDGDKKLDLVAGSMLSTFLILFTGNGDGTFNAGKTIDSGAPVAGLAIDDFDGDGHADLAVVDDNQLLGAGRLAILLGSGKGTFQPAVPYAAGKSPHAVVSGDFNGDGKPDLAVASAGVSQGSGVSIPGGELNVLLNQGNGRFAAAVPYAAGISPRGLVALDLDGDGRRDLAVASYGDASGTGRVNILHGLGTGTFRAETP